MFILYYFLILVTFLKKYLSYVPFYKDLMSLKEITFVTLNEKEWTKYGGMVDAVFILRLFWDYSCKVSLTNVIETKV